MDLVHEQEKQAELLAHVLDDVLHVPRTRLRFGIDPVLGLLPVVGDIMTVLCGSLIVLAARRLHLPINHVMRMAYHQALNGVIGAIPIVGDLYSFGFKSHAKNAAMLVRILKHGQGNECALIAPSVSLIDVAVVASLTLPVALAAGLLGWFFWARDLSILSLLFW